jgi:cyclic pyranopterin phosphate synthase
MPTLSHLDARGKARMVDVGGKPVTDREALAAATVRMRPATVALIRGGMVPKGDVFTVAKTAGILAAKRVDELIPLCHSLRLDFVDVEFRARKDRVEVLARVRTQGRTGAEMEALTAAAVACLTIYDMCKSADKGMVIGELRLLEKKGGRSGHYLRRERI